MSGRFQYREDLQDYLDGRLDDRRKTEIVAYLEANPDAADHIKGLQQQNEALQRLGAAILEEPVPERLRSIVHHELPSKAARPSRRSRSPWLQAAAAVILFVAGGAGGWWLHGVRNPLPTPVDILLQNSSYALSFYGSDEGFPIGFSPEQSDELADWIEKLFGKAVPYPDLSSNNYQYSGGNILPWADGETIFYLYSRAQGAHRISVIAWASREEPSDSPTIAELGDYAASYWYNGHFGYAVLGNSADDGLGDVSKSIYKFYEDTTDQG